MDKISITKQAFKIYHANLSSYLSISSIFGTIALLCFVLAYFFPISLILSVPIIFSPSIFALQASLMSLNSKEEGSPIKIYFKYFGLYFTSLFRGGYRSLIGLIKALAALSIITTLVAIPISIVAYQTIPELKDIIVNNATLTPEQLDAIILNNNLLKYGSMFAVGGGLLAGSYFYIHHLFAHSLIYASMLHTNEPLVMRAYSYIFRIVFSYFRRTFYKEYYKAVWWLIIIYIIGYCLGFSGLLLLKKDFIYYSPQIIGLAGGFILILFFLPYVFNVVELILINHIDEYNRANMNATMTLVNQLKAKGGLSPNEEEEITKTLNKLNTDINKDNKGNEDEKK